MREFKAKWMVRWAGSLIVTIAIPAFAHHSTNLYFDVTKTVDVQGTITGLSLQNPHSHLKFTAVDSKGGTHEWTAETHNAAALVRLGWRQNTFAVGDKVVVKGNPSRTEGQYAMYLVSVTFANGKVVTPNAPVVGQTH